MTGMGSDGAQGMRAIYEAGGLTVGQDEASCAVYGMPRACAEQGVLHRVVTLENIPDQILQAIRYWKPNLRRGWCSRPRRGDLGSDGRSTFQRGFDCLQQ